MKITDRKYTLEEYFELDKNSEVRHEFYEGEVLAMAGTIRNHNRLAKKVTRLLDDAFVEKGCEVMMERIKVFGKYILHMKKALQREVTRL